MWGNGSEDLVEKRGQGTEKDRKREREAEWEHTGTERERVYEEVGWGMEQSFQKMPHLAEDADANCWAEPRGIVSKPMHPTMA